MRFLKAVPAMLLIFAFSGCTTMEQHPGLKMVVKGAVQYATWKVIEKEDITAARVVEVTNVAIALVQGKSAVTLQQLEQAAREQINWQKMSAEDAFAVNTLISAVRAELEVVLTDSELISPKNAVLIVGVLEWVKEAAMMRADAETTT